MLKCLRRTLIFGLTLNPEPKTHSAVCEESPGTRTAPYRGYIRIMEKKMETTIQGLGCRVDLRVILGLYWDNGEENGNYYSGFRV